MHILLDSIQYRGAYIRRNDDPDTTKLLIFIIGSNKYDNLN